VNPLPLVGAELRRNPLGCAAVVALIAVAVALGVAVSARERAWRQQFRGGATTALFPAEVLNPPHSLLGNVHDLLRAVTFAFDGLLVTAVLLLIVAVLSARRQSVGALRALGAPPAFVFVTVWLQGVLLIGAGVLFGLALGFILAKAIGAFAGAELGFDVDAAIGAPEFALCAALLIPASLLAAAPSLPLLRVSATRLLRLQ